MPESTGSRFKTDGKTDKKGVIDPARAQRERTAKLKALRLAKEAEDRAAASAAPTARSRSGKASPKAKG